MAPTPTEATKQAGETSFVNYNDASKSYDSARDPLGCDIILGSMATGKTGKLLHEQVLLDQGCGTGNYISEVLPHVGAIHAQDFSDGMLEKCRVKFADEPKVKSINGGSCAEMPGYENNSMDAIMNNQVVQHIETDETRPTRDNLRKTCEESFRVLRPGGVFIISTRSKAPQYDHLYWYSILAPKAVAKMSERVPSREEVCKSLEGAGFEVTQVLCPLEKSIMNMKHYLDPEGVFSQEWRRGESFWSLVEEDELASLQAAVKAKIDDGTIHDWIAERDQLRKASGQVLFVVATKPLEQ